MSKKRHSLKALIACLTKEVAAGGLTPKQLDKAIGQLTVIDSEYEYDDEKFPALLNTVTFAPSVATTPMSLAEALLWKLGKWKAYLGFAGHFERLDSTQRNEDVVFYAFAKHLRDNANPIFDQHSLRALWAICPSLSSDERENFKRFLMTKKGKWKEAGSGRTAMACYDIFVRRLKSVVRGGGDMRKLDRLLMPLGQAIKKNTDTYDAFIRLLP